MDLAALFSGTFEAALEAVEKRAEDVRAGHVKAASGINDWVNQHIGEAARSGAADRIGNWWRDASADPAKLGLIGAGTGLGLGAVGGLMQPKGRRRPLQGALLGGLMGGAAMGGVGLARQLAANKAKPYNDLNAARATSAAAQEAATTTDMARNPLKVHRAVGRDLGDAARRAAAGDLGGAVDSTGKALSNADILGVQEIFDDSGKNDKWAPTTLLNKGVGKLTGGAESLGMLNKGEGANIAEYLKVPTANPAAESLVGLGAADLALSRRAGSLYNPKFLREGLSTAAGRDLLSSAVGRDQIENASQQLRTLSRGQTRTALGGNLSNRLVNNATLGRNTLNSGFSFQPPTPAAPPVPVGGTPPPPPVAPPRVRLSQDDLQSVSEAGKQKMMAGRPERGFLRSGFGSAEGGRLGGIGVSRGLVYPIVPTAVHWTQTRAQNHNAAVANLGAAQAAQGKAQTVVDGLKKPVVPPVKPPGT